MKGLFDVWINKTVNFLLKFLMKYSVSYCEKLWKSAEISKIFRGRLERE